MNINPTKLFKYMCKNGHLEDAQHILEVYPTIDISDNNEYAFRIACCCDHLQIAQWLYEMKPTLDISADDESAFQFACQNGHLEVAQWLYQVKPTINISALNIQTACNHTFCETCIQTWFNSNKDTCPYCRTCLNNTVFQPIATH